MSATVLLVDFLANEMLGIRRKFTDSALLSMRSLNSLTEDQFLTAIHYDFQRFKYRVR